MKGKRNLTAALLLASSVDPYALSPRLGRRRVANLDVRDYVRSESEAIPAPVVNAPGEGSEIRREQRAARKVRRARRRRRGW